MHTHYLKHVPFEGLGSIDAWLQAAGHTVTCTQFYASENLPQAEEIDFLVILGGPMSVNDEGEYPWLVPEKAFIRSVIRSGKPVLGICLGAQLIADVMGGRVYKNPVKEIGWFPVQAVALSNAAAFLFPPETLVFHWHGETFSLPPGAVHLANSKACANQAFQIGQNVIGLQFHLETTPESAQAIVTHCREELVSGEFIQTEKEILSAWPEQYGVINRLMGDILEYLCHYSRHK